MLVPDVDAFPGHIACDGASRSELVVPIVQGGEVSRLPPVWFLQIYADESQVKAIIDIDCAELNGFDEEDQAALEKLADLLAKSCDF